MYGRSSKNEMASILMAITHYLEEAKMNNITTIGLDLAKQIFQVHGVDQDGHPVLKKQLRRGQVVKFLRSFRRV